MPMLKPSDIGPLAGPWDWIYYKTYLSLWLQTTDDVLHVMAGMALLTLGALMFRRAPWHWLPWLFAAAIEAANELYDVFQTAYSTDEGNWASAWHDFWLTMLWPTIVVLTFGWLARRAKPRSDAVIVAVPGDEPRDADVDRGSGGVP